MEMKLTLKGVTLAGFNRAYARVFKDDPFRSTFYKVLVNNFRILMFQITSSFSMIF
jgi:hypothetical protein